MAKTEKIREPAEDLYALELKALQQCDEGARPPAWKLSPQAVLKYIIGGESLELKGRKTPVKITTKFFGDRRLVERAIVTLVSDRALLLVGAPGTGKSWLSEHLTAAITGNSTLTIQGTAGTTEEHIKYSWNVAKVIAEGFTTQNMVPSPTMVAMQNGGILRFEEITRCVPDVQDGLVSLLSEKTIAVPELPDNNMIWAKPGFNVIATANDKDQGVNELSAALKRRFNYIHIPLVADKKTEIDIVRQRCADLIERQKLKVNLDDTILDLIVTVFRELRVGKSEEGVALKSPGTTLSTAESIACVLEAVIHAHYYGDGTVGPEEIALNVSGSMVKEDQNDKKALKEYLDLVVKKRGETDSMWKAFNDSARVSF